MEELEQQECCQGFFWIVARGGLLKPVAGGTYVVNEKMLQDLERPREHASNLGAAIAYDIASGLGIPAFIVDPVAVDEMEPIAESPAFRKYRGQYVSCTKPRPWHGRWLHNLAKNERSNFIVAHLGTGISVAAHRRAGL